MSEAMEKRPALGKGLSALIPDAPEPTRASPVEVDIDRLDAERLSAARADGRCAARGAGAVDHAPTASFSRSSSARSAIAFRSSPASAAGAPRRSAGLLRVPVVVRDVAAGQEQSLLEMALIENIQREDLNPIDEALAYRRLADEFHLTQEDIATAVGKDRASVANFLRLLKLPDEVRSEVAVGHACRWATRARCSSLADEADQRRLARDVIARSLSVRETESLVEEDRRGGKPAARGRRRRSRSTSTRAPRKIACKLAARHARPHRPPGHARPHRDRFRLRRRADPDLRPAHGQQLTTRSSRSGETRGLTRDAVPHVTKGGTVTKRLTQMVSCAG